MHLLLLASLVHLSSSVRDPNEVFMSLKDGFPDGSLLTVYFKKLPSSDKSVFIKLCKDSEGENCLHFRLDGGYVASVMSGKSNHETPSDVPMLPDASRIGWWQFDLYKINDKQFLPFFQGFEAKVRANLDSTGLTLTEVRIRPEWATEPNYDMDDVYVTIKHPETSLCTPDICKPETVIEAVKEDSIKKSRTQPRTNFFSLPNGFEVGQKIRVSALLVQKGAYYDDHVDKNFASIYFFNKAENWAFGFYTRWSKLGAFVELHLFNGIPCPDCSNVNKWDGKGSKKCHGTGTSSDIVHVKLERPKDNTIKMRVYYMNGKAGGITCELIIPDVYKADLDGELKVQGDNMGTLLHLEMV